MVENHSASRSKSKSLKKKKKKKRNLRRGEYLCRPASDSVLTLQSYGAAQRRMYVGICAVYIWYLVFGICNIVVARCRRLLDRAKPQIYNNFTEA